jgi:hypothetical protein
VKRQDELTRRIQCRRAKAAKRSQKGRQREKGRCTLGYLHTGDLRAVQDFLGHADPRMTAKYAHVVDMAKKNPALFIPVKVGGRIAVWVCPAFRACYLRLALGKWLTTARGRVGRRWLVRRRGRRRGIRLLTWI